MKHLVTIACLLTAMCFYALGFSSGAAVFTAVGLLAESFFWFRLFRRNPQPLSAPAKQI
ncbi:MULTISPECIES: hypothetical protein [unclassified Rhodanobacter]|jgi:hypothetical protein|uniref:hypothetical protein n=1 Tax=unclassified Rhodanobacter TaxID=2621553 RepID=UPI001609183D|nr:MULTISPECIES: hypothetical protein [unclassified Rhodanobacter]MBB6243889.1 positive regulator of sigma E activity [Rhodanobacter sp. MP1X3]MBB6248014.1 positive regulator of sigma E activity [Rhodanobacter sp. A1T4]